MVNLAEKHEKRVADYNRVIVELHHYIFFSIISNDILSFVNSLQISFFSPHKSKIPSLGHTE